MKTRHLLIFLLFMLPFFLQAQTIENGVLTSCSGVSGEYRVPDNVREIGEGAFFYSGVTKVYIPASVEIIGKSAFYLSQSLQRVEFASGSKLKTVRDLAFSECIQLQQIDIPNSVDSIGANAFTFCDALRTVTLPTNLKQLSYGTFSSCTALTRIVVPQSCKVIGEFAFGNCTGLSYVDIQGADSISTKAFYHCSVLPSLKLPETLKVIGDSAFMRCEALVSLEIPASLEKVGDKLFLRCPHFEGFTVAAGSSNFMAENGVLYSKDKAILHECPQQYATDMFEISASTKAIRPMAFFECNAVKGISIPETIEGIGIASLSNNGMTVFNFKGNERYCFHDGVIYAKLKSQDGWALLATPCQGSKTDLILLPKTVFIADYALACCTNLKNVTMPESLKYVGSFAFYNDQALKNLTCYAVEAPQLLECAFGEVPFNKVYLHVKPGSINSYQLAEWLFLIGDDITGEYPYTDEPAAVTGVMDSQKGLIVCQEGSTICVKAGKPVSSIAIYDLNGCMIKNVVACGEPMISIPFDLKTGVNVMRVFYRDGKNAVCKF